MTRDEAKNKLLEIMEGVEEAHGQCGKCPFRGILDDYYFIKCPFRECPEIWVFEKE